MTVDEIKKDFQEKADELTKMDGYFTAKVKYNVTSVQAFVEKI
jgi:phage-related tail protein